MKSVVGQHSTCNVTRKLSAKTACLNGWRDCLNSNRCSIYAVASMLNEIAAQVHRGLSLVWLGNVHGNRELRGEDSRPAL